ncbi:MAG: hypothetical protein L0Y35_08460 [Flammeovirgaceae bacterium]|nr:hypothetical protein [Flammeovirgaceae bacterium]
MELRDFIVTPLVLFAVYVAAWFIRPQVSDELTRRYFLPALTLKIIGALAVGFIYQFYYKGGDTFAYHTHGSRVLWEIFMESPSEGIRTFFLHGYFGPGMWDISDRIWYWRDEQSFFVIQFAAFFDLFTFSTYSATAVLFAALGFTGSWMLFLVFYKTHKEAVHWFAISCLFIPSTLFWGSGILKDTITFAFIGMGTFSLYRIFFERRVQFQYLALLIFSFYTIYSIKKYILISLVAAVIVWVASGYLFKVRSIAMRMLIIPFVICLCAALTYFSINKVVEDDPRYSLDKIAQTSMITAYDIRYGWGAREGEGSGYTLGELDGTWQSMIRLAPEAINVSLFRPYLWEVSNPLMMLSAIESLVTLFFTLGVVLTVRGRILKYLKTEVIFCLVFALIFAFGVGVSTFNFGTLSRYKIPLLPFYWTALAMIYVSWKQDKLQEFTSDLN